MSEKLYLPVSILLSALILSGTLFLASAQISTQIQLSDLAVGQTGTTGTGGSAVAQAAPKIPQPTQAPPSQGSADLASLSDGAQILYGNPDASVQIVEFSDFGCPFCNRVAPTLDALSQKYGDDLVIYYAHFPILNLHPDAKIAAIASECAAEQDKFKEYHDVLFVNQPNQANPKAHDSTNLKQYASDLGLDTAKFNACLDTSKYGEKVDGATSLGSSNGVSGTPTFFIGKKGENGTKLVGAQPPANFENVIDPLLG